MSRAHDQGSRIRRQLGLSGRVDAVAVAARLGLTVKPWPLRVLEEMRLDDYIVVADRLDPEWRRWVVGHAIGHCVLHPGNHLWMRGRTDLARGFEREAEDFAYGLLVDISEAISEGFVHSWEIAEHFGVPDEMVGLQAGALRA